LETEKVFQNGQLGVILGVWGCFEKKLHKNKKAVTESPL
jgi:hypothetical protein